MKRILMRILDVIMFILVLLLMAFHLTGQQLHEILGVMTLLCFFIHHLLNWKWHKNILKGTYQTPRKVMTFINVILFIDIICLGVSGILMSNFIFSFMPSFGLISLARKVHMIASYWGFVLMSVHLGFHWHLMLMPLRKKLKDKSHFIQILTFKILPVILCIAGAVIFIKNRIYVYMFSLENFVFFDYEMNIFGFIIEYLFISCLCIAGGYFVFKKITQRKKN